MICIGTIIANAGIRYGCLLTCVSGNDLGSTTFSTVAPVKGIAVNILKTHLTGTL
ncbi:hypothetical protein L873DRAFT_1817713 [Choiromyces venosus 120613-1]|uniref:Uncharacterized protein n=1 Tax=Choiromyces venosus 120613-1 TaxID=1336337 RepID=A0A3N4IW98_9PEZI|nr:hypothetical protein L873DRAFT_1824422 [Choiromyces venosus 120613-1]RPA92389.1 hypothetical protein L873DRAFT_1817713 [Choiromyces venosus 120613-1]